MIDLERLERIHLSARPVGQRIMAALLLVPNYHFPGRRTRIVLEGEEHLRGGGGVIFVMNHTDRYNYWPFQYELWRRGHGYTATWVKGKYYESRLLGWFMDTMNNIPLPSRGYVLTKDFQRALGRLPGDAEYAALKALADGKIDDEAARRQGGPGVAALLDRPSPDVASGRYLDSLGARFDAMMRRVVELNREALGLGLDLLIFPEGTRSRRLGVGHTGAAQIALHTGAPVVPVGCSGSDRCYPGNSPWSRGGTITYRIGEPLTLDGALAPYRVPEPFVPFTAGAERHAAAFRGATDVFMSRIAALVDPEYRPDGGGEGTGGASRFV